MRERLLVRHFLQRFIDNDLISPRADRHQVLSVAASALVACSVVSTVFLGSKFLLVSFQTPAQTAVAMLVDHFFFFGVSMVTLALAAVGVWQAVGVDERDAVILGPLPLSYAMVVRAKLKALALFALVFVAMLNLISAIGYSTVAVNVLPMPLHDRLGLAATQLLVSVLAGLFGFTCVMAVRETLRAIAGARWFARVTSLAQAVLVVTLGTLLLLLPGAMSNAPRWLASSSGMARFNPVVWFLGLNEAIAGRAFAGLPNASAYPDIVAGLERKAAAQYLALEPLTRPLAARALIAFAIVFTIALSAYLWNSRTLPLGVPLRARRRSWMAQRARSLAVIAVRTPAGRAGFFFAVKALWRSAPHRVSMATAAGAAIAATTVLLGNVPLHPFDDVGTAPASIFGMPMVALGLMTAGFRHAMRVPADLRAGWLLPLCWQGDERAYLSGVKWAGIATAALPALAATLWVAGATLPATATASAIVFTMLTTLLLFDIAGFRFENWPFASPYAANDSIAEVAPIYALGFIFTTFALAQLQRAAFATPIGAATLLGSTLLAVVIVRTVDSRPYPARTVETWNRGLIDAGRVNLSGVDW